MRKMILAFMQYSQSRVRQHHKSRRQKVIHVIARLPGCAGQAEPTQYQLTPRSKMEDAPKLLKIPKSECPDKWIRLPRHKWQTFKTRWFLLNEICTDTHLAASCGRDSELGMFVRASKARLFLSVYVDDIKNDWKQTKPRSYVEETDEKIVDLGEPTSFLDYVFLGCAQRKCKLNKK